LNIKTYFSTIKKRVNQIELNCYRMYRMLKMQLHSPVTSNNSIQPKASMPQSCKKDRTDKFIKPKMVDDDKFGPTIVKANHSEGVNSHKTLETTP